MRVPHFSHVASARLFPNLRAVIFFFASRSTDCEKIGAARSLSEKEISKDIVGQKVKQTSLEKFKGSKSCVFGRLSSRYLTKGHLIKLHDEETITLFAFKRTFCFLDTILNFKYVVCKYLEGNKLYLFSWCEVWKFASIENQIFL